MQTLKIGKKKITLRELLLDIFIGICLGIALGSAFVWCFTQYNYWEGRQEAEKLSQFATTPDPDANFDNPYEDGAPVIDWNGLKAINSEVVAWIQVPGTPIDYPVYQTDNNLWYLRHNAEGKWTIPGQIFLDCDNNAPGLVDQQSILYGHHLKDGTAFYHFFLLNDQETFDKTTTIWYVTEKKAYQLEPLFVYYTQPTDYEVRLFNFPSELEFHEYLFDRLKRAVTKRADAELLIPRVKHVLTCSTCNYYQGYGRSECVCAIKQEIDLPFYKENLEK